MHGGAQFGPAERRARVAAEVAAAQRRSRQLAGDEVACPGAEAPGLQRQPQLRGAVAQRRFDAPARRDVGKQHREAAIARPVDAEGVDVVPAVTWRGARALEPRRYAGGGDAAVEVQPVAPEVRCQFADPAAGGVFQAGMARERRVDLLEAVVGYLRGGIVFQLDDAKGRVDRVEQRQVTVLRIAQRRGRFQTCRRGFVCGQRGSFFCPPLPPASSPACCAACRRGKRHAPILARRPAGCHACI
jgi:hypothetical protein